MCHGSSILRFYSFDSVQGLFALLHAAEYSDSNAMYVIDEEALATEVQRSQVFGWEEVLHMIVMGSEALVADVSKVCFVQNVSMSSYAVVLWPTVSRHRLSYISWR